MKTATKPTKRNERNVLSVEQLGAVAGGALHVTKAVDKSPPNLFAACATGKHFLMMREREPPARHPPRARHAAVPR